LGEGREGAFPKSIKYSMPPKRSNPKTMHFAGELRRNPTPAEQKLWAVLRNQQIDGIRFRRQHAIGNFIVDFCAPRKKLVIELDGSQHLEQHEYDNERTIFLKSQGYQVFRFWNMDVMKDLRGVITTIQHALKDDKKDSP
jgi:very-short-patch-repair endonuclease